MITVYVRGVYLPGFEIVPAVSMIALAAAVAGRNYVIPDDIKGIALQIISHRINMKPEAKIRGITGMHIVRKILSEVPVPVIQPA